MFKRSSAPATHDFILRICRSAGLEPNIVKQSDRAQSILVDAGVLDAGADHAAAFARGLDTAGTDN